MGRNYTGYADLCLRRQASGIDAGTLLLGGRATSARVNQLFDHAIIPDNIHIADRYIMLTAHTPAYQIDMARCPVILGLANFICEALGFDVFINIYDQAGHGHKAHSNQNHLQ
jgi:hypothetical protein